MKKLLLFAIAVSLTSIASAYLNSWCNSIPSELHGCATCCLNTNPQGPMCEDLIANHQPAKNCCWAIKQPYRKYGCTTDYYATPQTFPAQCLEVMGATPSEYPGRGAKGKTKGSTKGTSKKAEKATKSVKANVAPAKVTAPAKSAEVTKKPVVQKAENSKKVAK